MKYLIVAALLLTACEQRSLPYIPIKPVCFQEGDIQRKFFYSCLNEIPEANRTAKDLSACDDVSIIQATTECVSEGFAP